MKILAVDYGDSRTGLAVCDPGEILATPLRPQIEEKAMAKVAAQVCAAAREHGAGLIVIGLPRNMDGTEGARAKKSRKLAELVQQESGLPVRMWDERQTTVSAIGYLNETNTRGKKRKQVIDAVAATIILENYLAYRKNQREE